MLSALRNNALVPRAASGLIARRKQQSVLTLFALKSSGGQLTVEERKRDLEKWPGIPEHVRPNYIPRIPIDPVEYDELCDRYVSQSNLWKYMSYFVAIPAILVLSYMNLIVHQDHQRPEFKDWDHLRPRMKWFFGRVNYFY
ncbi:unnamed protein product [Didymodactylos carnosus]|uniref:Uncharacterized protein n=1 Tax=Didymodactylos carnosus TaxID=1234261 RepID=A0A813TP12_9BILA|nr:unnamed protein product [Didymodactylos carnosus]CAF3597561.1 unnamed protein product [Didymodactylos carnosus]